MVEILFFLNVKVQLPPPQAYVSLPLSPSQRNVPLLLWDSTHKSGYIVLDLYCVSDDIAVNKKRVVSTFSEGREHVCPY